jgi:exosortase/archaeosortase family protein
MSFGARSVLNMSQSMSFPAPTDTVRPRPSAATFALKSVAWSLGLFGLLRLGWIESHAVLPLTRLQGALATGVIGAPSAPVDVTLACSGTDAIALCLGAVLAYPVTWRRRVWGATTGMALIVGLNTIRIGTLGRAAASPEWFNALHVYVWPAILMLAIAGFLFLWMSSSDNRVRAGAPAGSIAATSPRFLPSRRFAGLTVLFLILFTLATPLLYESALILTLGGFIAHAAAVFMTAWGGAAYATANVLWTPRGAFAVTPECISTPLVPIYVAFVCAYFTTFRRLLAGLAATVPLFTALAIARVLVVALPPAIVESPVFFVHAFYQLLLAVVILFLAAVWRHGGRTGPRYAAVGVLAAACVAFMLSRLYTPVMSSHLVAQLEDPQGAIAFLPAFQIALYLGLWVAAFAAVGWGRFFAGLAAVMLTQTAGLLALQTIAANSGTVAHVRDIRAWAVAGPVLIFATVISYARPRR